MLGALPFPICFSAILVMKFPVKDQFNSPTGEKDTQRESINLTPKGMKCLWFSCLKHEKFMFAVLVITT